MHFQRMRSIAINMQILNACTVYALLHHCLDCFNSATHVRDLSSQIVYYVLARFGYQPGYRNEDGNLVVIKEMIPEFVVPDLTGFKVSFVLKFIFI